MFSPPRKLEPVGAPVVPPKPDNSTAPISPSAATLSSGVSIKGSVKFQKELIIDGEVEGTIDSTGRLTVGKNARIRGEVNAGAVTVLGTVEGNITAQERCDLRTGCTLRGDIEAPRLVVDDDATFIGSAKITARGKS